MSSPSRREGDYGTVHFALHLTRRKVGERCWVAAGRTIETGLVLQGLIQIVVACLKYEQGFTDVARCTAEEGPGKFPRSSEEMLCVYIQRLHADERNHLQSAGPTPVIVLTAP